MKKKFRNPIVAIILGVQLLIIATLLVMAKNVISQGIIEIILMNIVFPLSISSIFLIIGKTLFENPENQENFEKKIISEHENGFKSIVDDFDFSKPLKILFTNLRIDQLPMKLEKNLHKFSSVEIALDHSKKTAEARAVALDRENYFENGLAKSVVLLDSLKHTADKSKIFQKKLKVCEIKEEQFPVGLMIHNDENIFFAPLWNYENAKGGSAADVYLKIPTKSKTGQRMIKSFDKLFKNGTPVDIGDNESIKKIHV